MNQWFKKIGVGAGMIVPYAVVTVALPFIPHVVIDNRFLAHYQQDQLPAPLDEAPEGGPPMPPAHQQGIAFSGSSSVSIASISISDGFYPIT